MMRLRFDPVSGALYFRVREGEIEETIPLADPGFGASVDVDREGNVMGLEFLSLEEFTEIIARSGGTLEIPDVVEDRESPLSLEGPESLGRWLEASIGVLTPRQYAFLHLYFDMGLKMSEISKELGPPEDEVRKEMGAAINILRTKLAAGEDVDSLRLEERLEKVLRGG